MLNAILDPRHDPIRPLRMSTITAYSEDIAPPPGCSVAENTIVDEERSSGIATPDAHAHEDDDRRLAAILWLIHEGVHLLDPKCVRLPGIQVVTPKPEDGIKGRVMLSGARSGRAARFLSCSGPWRARQASDGHVRPGGRALAVLLVEVTISTTVDICLHIFKDVIHMPAPVIQKPLAGDGLPVSVAEHTSRDRHTDMCLRLGTRARTQALDQPLW